MANEPSNPRDAEKVANERRDAERHAADQRPGGAPGMRPQTDAESRDNDRRAREAQDADRKAREQRGEAARKGTEAARESSAETLAEQEGMTPVPSQEDADAIKAGAVDPLEREDDEQPEGPQQRKAEGRPDSVHRVAGADDDKAGYKTRQAQPRKDTK